MDHSPRRFDQMFDQLMEIIRASILEIYVWREGPEDKIIEIIAIKIGEMHKDLNAYWSSKLYLLPNKEKNQILELNCNSHPK